MKYRNKPVEIEAIQLRWDTWNEICQFVPEQYFGEGVYVTKDGLATDISTDRIGFFINTLEGKMLAIENDWIIKGVQGEFYPCKPDIFEMTYEKVEE